MLIRERGAYSNLIVSEGCLLKGNTYLSTGAYYSKYGRDILNQNFIQALLSTAIFSQRFSFFTVCLVQWPMGCPQGRHQRKNFWNLGLQIAGKFIFLIFFWNFRVSWGVLRISWLERYIQLSFMHVCKYLNQRVRIIGE